MKVLLITPVPPRDKVDGGLATVLYARLRGLIDVGHEVVLVTPCGPDPEEARAVAALRSEGVAVVVASRHLGHDRWRRRARMAWRWLAGTPWRTVWFGEPGLQEVIDDLVGAERFDIVDVQDNSMAGYRLPTSVPRILTEHEVRRRRPRTIRPPGSLTDLKFVFAEADWRRWYRYQRLAWGRFDAIEVFTPRDAESLSSIAPELVNRVRVVPFGIVIPPRRDVGAEADGATIAFIGNYTHSPNVDAAQWLVRDILPLVRRRVPDAKVRLAGAQAPVEVHELSSDAVEVVGRVDDADDFLRRATVVVAPVRTGGGMRVKVLHAMASGQALVVTGRGAEGLSSSDRHGLLIADDSVGFADAIVRLMTQPEERARLGAEARRIAEERFGPVPAALRITEMYEAVLAGKRPGLP